MPPEYLVSHTFLGQACGAGINPVFRDKLVGVEQALQDQFNDLADSDKQDPDGNPAPTLIAWAGLREPLIGWRPNAGYHSSGSAADINVTTNPYIVTRTNGKLGGEAAGASFTAMRQQAAAVYDRAIEFLQSTGATADVAARRSGESTSDVYDRFRAASDALLFYLTFVFKGSAGSKRISRAPIADVENASTDVLDNQIPAGELRTNKDQAIADLETFLSSQNFIDNHPDWPNDATTQYYRIIRDYELVRIPMVFGNPSESPASTRNPARGFINLRKELVVALCDIGGLRWGASDFGDSQSGDIQHFDLNGHGGFTPGNS